jgi:hypothetical protein
MQQLRQCPSSALMRKSWGKECTLGTASSLPGRSRTHDHIRNTLPGYKSSDDMHNVLGFVK